MTAKLSAIAIERKKDDFCHGKNQSHNYIFFLIINIRKFDWKNKRLKEDAAFLPGMAGALFLFEVITQSIN